MSKLKSGEVLKRWMGGTRSLAELFKRAFARHENHRHICIKARAVGSNEGLSRKNTGSRMHTAAEE